MKRLLVAPLLLAIVAVAGHARAEEKPTGTWKWEVKAGDQSFDITLTLKLESDKVTGTINSALGETAIQDDLQVHGKGQWRRDQGKD
jgi:hypothetical protein